MTALQICVKFGNQAGVSLLSLDEKLAINVVNE